MESLQEFWDKFEQATPSTRLLYHAAGYADREKAENIEDVYKRLNKGVKEHKAAQEHVPEEEHVSWVERLKPQFSLFYEYNARKGTAPRASLQGPDVPTSEGGRTRAREVYRVLESLKAYKGDALETQIDVLLAKAKEDAKRKPEELDTASTPPEKKQKKKTGRK